MEGCDGEKKMKKKIEKNHDGEYFSVWGASFHDSYWWGLSTDTSVKDQASIKMTGFLLPFKSF